jgi:hypothetical protein
VRAAGPTVVPVNFVLHEGAVWIRSTPYSMLAREAAGDRSRSRSTASTSPPSQGSVLLKGRGESKQPDELPPDLPYLQTWPEGPRPFVRAIDMREVTGKRLLAS